MPDALLQLAGPVPPVDPKWAPRPSRLRTSLRCGRVFGNVTRAFDAKESAQQSKEARCTHLSVASRSNQAMKKRLRRLPASTVRLLSVACPGARPPTGLV